MRHVFKVLALVFMIDRAGIMGNSKHGQNEDVRWKPVVEGLDAFFADSANANVHASVAFFGVRGSTQRFGSIA